MCNSFVVFDVPLVIFREQFHSRNISYTKHAHLGEVPLSVFPKGKRASGTATIIQYEKGIDMRVNFS